MQRLPGALSPGVKRPRHEAHHSPLSSAEFNNVRAITLLLHKSSWRGAQVFEHRNNFIFTLPNFYVGLNYHKATCSCSFSILNITYQWYNYMKLYCVFLLELRGTHLMTFM
jgi:hypothetical protein